MKRLFTSTLAALAATALLAPAGEPPTNHSRTRSGRRLLVGHRDRSRHRQRRLPGSRRALLELPLRGDRRHAPHGDGAVSRRPGTSRSTSTRQAGLRSIRCTTSRSGPTRAARTRTRRPRCRGRRTGTRSSSSSRDPPDRPEPNTIYTGDVPTTGHNAHGALMMRTYVPQKEDSPQGSVPFPAITWETTDGQVIEQREPCATGPGPRGRRHRAQRHHRGVRLSRLRAASDVPERNEPSDVDEGRREQRGGPVRQPAERLPDGAHLEGARRRRRDPRQGTDVPGHARRGARLPQDPGPLLVDLREQRLDARHLLRRRLPRADHRTATTRT